MSSSFYEGILFLQSKLSCDVWNIPSENLVKFLAVKCSLTSCYKGSFSEKSCAQVFKRALFFYRVNCHVLFEIVLLKISLLLNKTVHSFIGFFARTVIVEKWWLCSILSHKMGLQGHFYYMIKQSAFNIRKDSLANR